MPLNELAFVDLLTTQFAKLQDVIGSKIFPILLDIMQESMPTYSGLDRLHKLEKLHIIDATEEWIDMRDACNMIAHEYSTDPVVVADNLEYIRKKTELLLKEWGDVRDKIEVILKK